MSVSMFFPSPVQVECGRKSPLVGSAHVLFHYPKPENSATLPPKLERMKIPHPVASTYK